MVRYLLETRKKRNGGQKWELGKHSFFSLKEFEIYFSTMGI